VFYVQDDPNAKPAPGDLSGDGAPDYLRVDASGNLVMYQSGMDSANSAEIASPAADAPAKSGSWAGWQITHRGSMSGQYVDDLIAHRTGTADANSLYIYQNDGAGHFTAGQSSPAVTITDDSSTPSTGASDSCNCDLTKATQIVAIGYGDNGVADPHYPLPPQTPMSRNPAYFIAVIPTNGIDQEWLFTYHTTNTFYGYDKPISNFTSNVLASLQLFSPGDTNNDGLPDLWGMNTSTGEVVQFASDINKSDGTADWSGGIGSSTSTHVTTVPAGYDLSSVTSSGNRDSNRQLELWAKNTNGNIVLLSTPNTGTASMLTTVAGTGSTSGPKLSWTMGNAGYPAGNTTPAGATTPDSDIAISATKSNQILAAYDTSGSANTGTATGNVQAVATHDGKASTFDGASQMSTSGPVVDTSGAFTASVWVNPSSIASGNHEAVSEDSNLDSAFMLGYAGGPAAWWVYMPNTDTSSPGGPVVVAPNNSAAAGTWTHLVATYDPTIAGGTLKLYVNGQQVGPTATGVVGFKSVGSLVAGRAQYGGNKVDYWTGGIDDVTVYNRALGPSEITSIYDTERPRPLTPVQLNSNNADGSVVLCTSTPNPAGAANSNPVTTLTPSLSATAVDSDLTVGTHADFEVWDATNPINAQPIVLGSGSSTPAGSGSNATITTPTLTDGETYGWKVRTVTDDGTQASEFSQPCYFTVHNTAAVVPLNGDQVILGDNTIYTAAQNTTWQGPNSQLVFQSDGNLVVYGPNKSILAYSGTFGHPDATMVMQKDGNLVIYDGMPTIAANGSVTGNPIWGSATSGTVGARLIMDTTGKTSVYGPSGPVFTMKAS